MTKLLPFSLFVTDEFDNTDACSRAQTRQTVLLTNPYAFTSVVSEMVILANK